MTRLLALILPAALLPVLLVIGTASPIGALIFNLSMLAPFGVVMVLLHESEEVRGGQGAITGREAAL